MNQWSLSQISTGLHDSIEQRLKTVRKTLQHPGTKGDASENTWCNYFIPVFPSAIRLSRPTSSIAAIDSMTRSMS